MHEPRYRGRGSLGCAPSFPLWLRRNELDIDNNPNCIAVASEGYPPSDGDNPFCSRPGFGAVKPLTCSRTGAEKRSRSATGHFEPFPPPRLNGRCPFSLRMFTRTPCEIGPVLVPLRNISAAGDSSGR